MKRNFTYYIKKSIFFTFIWTIASLFFISIRHIGMEEIGLFGSVIFEKKFWQAITVGVLSGVMYALLDIFLPPQFTRRKSFGFIVIMKSLIFIIVFILISTIARIQGQIFEGNTSAGFLESLVSIFTETGKNTLAIFIYTSVFALFLNFMQQVDRKFGPGMLFKTFIGKYHKPQEEHKLFMFIDVISSTSMAEKLGHLLYSEMMQDFFYDLSDKAYNYRSWIYQYVGDEAVLTWDMDNNQNIVRSIKLFYAIKDTINRRKNFYLKKYGMVPAFRAGAHTGIVTIAEVGKLKREIAYHGDTINTASRIQHKAKILDKELLISEDTFKQIENINFRNQYRFENLGKFSIFGKKEPIGLFSVERL